MPGIRLPKRITGNENVCTEYYTVHTFSESKDEISKDIQRVNFEQLKVFLNK